MTKQLRFFVTYPEAEVFKAISPILPSGLILVQHADEKAATAWAKGAMPLDLHERAGAFFPSLAAAREAAREMGRNLKTAAKSVGLRVVP